MSLSLGQLKRLASELDGLLSGNRLSKCVQFSKDVFTFALSKAGQLVISLRSDNPFLTVIEKPRNFTSFSSNSQLFLKKEVSNGLIKSVSCPFNDRVIRIELECINSVFKEEARYLYLELIPSRANMVLVDAGQNILFVLKAINKEDRILFKGLKYQEPSGSLVGDGDVFFNFPDYLKHSTVTFGQLMEVRKKEKFHDLITAVNNRLRSAKRKLDSISSDVDKAKEHLNDGEYGDILFMNLSQVDPSLGSFAFEGMEIKLDKRLSVSQNAQAFYKRAKRAKHAIESSTANLERAKKEVQDFTAISEMLSSADEEEIVGICEEFGLESLLKKEKKETVLSSSLAPHEIVHDGVSYVFGKSASQNDYLTFLFDTSKKHTWMHLEGHTGSHLMIRSDTVTPEQIAYAAQILCLASKLEDGQAMYCLRKDVRKGKVPGEAIVSSFKTVNVSHIDDSVRGDFLNAKRAKIK